ncbi:cytochrome P450 [Linderina pennispora]|uniref:Cytochrome P450 n=1 Tax=Linderina pennispora TaxID=61395 RepID=A0A1Y1W4Y4_9FUNG|nr:cytochrome P450 [Linderina pennispora]ORX68577.1 cytochrome P450 [Linderina pennispora]
MLVAGTDTTSNTITYAIVHLLHNPSVYKRVTEEVRSTFPDSSQVISFKDAKAKLPYLSAVIYETMRINPPVSGMLPRSAPAKGITIQGYNIPHDTQIGVSIAACHRNPHTWKNPMYLTLSVSLVPTQQSESRIHWYLFQAFAFVSDETLLGLNFTRFLPTPCASTISRCPRMRPMDHIGWASLVFQLKFRLCPHIGTNLESPKSNC